MATQLQIQALSSIYATAMIPCAWIPLNNQYNIDMLHNPKLLTNIRQVDESMDIYYNPGTATTNLTALSPVLT